MTTMIRRIALGLAGAAALFAGRATAAPVGETWRVYADPTAAVRDFVGRDQVRVTVWYPAADGSTERALTIGPPTGPWFVSGKDAPQAGWADGAARPLIVMSHGFGGMAAQYGWLADALVQDGYVVAAVDHPGNNGFEKATEAGAALWWQRADDITAALNGVLSDPTLSAHIDASRVGMVGYSMGGSTGALIAGARIDFHHLNAYCDTAPKEGLCQLVAGMRAKVEAPGSEADKAAFADAYRDFRDPRVKAVFLIAPAMAQAMSPASLAAIRIPVSVFSGDHDDAVDWSSNAKAYVAAINGARLTVEPGAGHYEFLGLCQAAGVATYPQLCKDGADRAKAHGDALRAATGFFDSALKAR